MRILHLADLHIGKKVHSYSMLEEQRHILCEETMYVIRDNNIEVVLIAGDIYDTPMPSGQAVELFDEFLTLLNELNIKVYIIPGNHDSAERMSFASDILKNNSIYISKPLNYDVDNARLESYELCDEYGKVNIYLMPYLRSGNVKEIIDNTDIDKNERNILVAHQFVSCIGYENELSDSEVISVGGVDNIDVGIFDEFDYVALGHLHAPQHIGRETVRYAGSILKYSFSETDQKKSFTIIDFREKKNISIEKIPVVPINDMRKIKGPINKLLSEDIYKDGNVNDYIQATITDEEEVFDAMRRLKEVYVNLLKLDFDNSRTRAHNKVENIDNVEKKDELTLFKEFFKNRTDMELTEDEEKVMIDIINGVNKV